MPLWSDYLLRRDHENGEDVSKIGNIPGLVRNLKMESPAEALAADGDRQLVFLYDLSQEPVVESVEIEVLLGNDYRVDVATLFEADPRAKSYHGQYKSTFYETVVRARDNVQDMTNLKRVRFHVGEDTGVFAYSADLNLTLRGLEVNAEYARSALYSRYPAHTEGRVPDFRSGPRFSQKDDAAYANATHWFKAGRVGAELFSINPEFTTSLPHLFEDRGLLPDPFLRHDEQHHLLGYGAGQRRRRSLQGSAATAALWVSPRTAGLSTWTACFWARTRTTTVSRTSTATATMCPTTRNRF